MLMRGCDARRHRGEIELFCLCLLPADTVTSERRTDLYVEHAYRDMEFHFTSSQTGKQVHLDPRKDLINILGVKQNFSTAYHPQTDGQADLVNRVVVTCVRPRTNCDQDDSTDYRLLDEFAHNIAHNNSSLTDN